LKKKVWREANIFLEVREPKKDKRKGGAPHGDQWLGRRKGASI